MSEKVAGGHVGVGVEGVVVLGVVKELPLVHVSALVVLAHADIEILDPAKLSVNVPRLGDP